MQSLVIVGASLAGLSAAETARREGYEGRLTMLGAERHLPYDRPPLSKQLLAGTMQPDALPLRSTAEYEGLHLDIRLGVKAVSLDPRQRRLALDNGSELDYDGLILATGASPWRPPGWYRRGVFDLRTMEDSMALRAAFAGQPRVAVVGAGFIGCEVAATARTLGLEVTLVEALPAPLIRAVGPAMGQVIVGMHADHGVVVHCGRAVDRLLGGERVEALRLVDGRVVPADVVVLGLGVRPQTAWLETSGLRLGDGVVCDQYCAAAPGVYAAGDVARWHHPLLGATTRAEHWTNATQQGAAAARNLLNGAAAEPFAPIPYFWSDQYDVRIQMAGWPRFDDQIHIEHSSVLDRRAVALYGHQGRLIAALTLNWPRGMSEYRKLLGTEASWDSGLSLTAAWTA